jgi:hypothetical protein
MKKFIGSEGNFLVCCSVQNHVFILAAAGESAIGNFLGDFTQKLQNGFVFLAKGKRT